ncbi:MAG: twin-arginine translocation signal domain-containing protein [Cephaloticoccus sp.]
MSSTPHPRRDFLKTLLAGGLALPLGTFASPPGPAVVPGASDALDGLLPGFACLTPEEKVRRVERLTSAGRQHPSGIMVCMPYVAPEGLRVVRPEDFAGQDQFSFNFGHKFKSVTDFFTNENSVTASGSHLAAQSIRFKATGEAAALAAARAAYRSLRIVFEFGVAHGVPGFMGKPFHFEYSEHTTGDQYLHTMWGLWNFHEVASEPERAEVRAMFPAMADYQIKVDYQIFNRKEGQGAKSSAWNNRLDPTDYNAIMAAMMAGAYRFSGDAKYRKAYEFVMQAAKWRTHRRLDYIVEQFRQGTYRAQPWDKIAGAKVDEGEFAHWEQIQHCQFLAISAVIIHESLPDLFNAQELADTLALWWADQPMGFDRVDWNYLYWFIISTKDRSWRPVELTRRLPREEWMGGHPMLSFASKWVYADCLARFQWTALVVARHCPQKRDEAVAFAGETLKRFQPRHLLWISDPDGRQLPPAVNYFSRFLSSEMPENLIASYWEGRLLNLWT